MYWTTINLTKNILLLLFSIFFLNFEFLFKTVNSLGSNNAKEHKVYPKSGKGAYMWFSYVSQILYEISADTTWGVIWGPLFNLMFKHFRLSEFFCIVW